MSATDELRRLLDERGVEWDYGITGSTTTRFSVNGTDLTFTPMRNGLVCSTILTPEQAVAATLGRGNAGRYVGLRQGEYWERTENSDYYCGGCGWKVTDHDSYCPECGGALHKSALGTCHADETETVICSYKGRGNTALGRDFAIHVMECSECGRTYEHVNGDYEYCPHCGRKVVDV